MLDFLSLSKSMFQPNIRLAKFLLAEYLDEYPAEWYLVGTGWCPSRSRVIEEAVGPCIDLIDLNHNGCGHTCIFPCCMIPAKVLLKIYF